MFNWKKILTGNNNHSSIKIKAEIESLINDREQLEAQDAELETSLQGLQIDLLSDDPGALKAVKEAEASINENKNRVSAIQSVVKSLERKLEESLINEKNNRQIEIIKETAIIDEHVAEKRLELVKAYSKACALYTDLTGREYSKLSFNFFIDCKLSKDVHDEVEGLERLPINLFRQRENLLNEGNSLRKKYAS